MKRIALVGNPNTGKTTLFNNLTGLSQKTGNYPGVTVEKKTGRVELNGEIFEVIDLPGIYSYTNRSEEEKVTTAYLLNEKIDVVIYTVDASNLKSGLLLFSQLVDLNFDVVVSVHMNDTAKEKGIVVDFDLLKSQLNCRILNINPTSDNAIIELSNAIKEEKNPRKFIGEFDEDSPQILKRFEQLEKILAGVITKREQKNDKEAFLDSIFLHPILGYGSFVLIMLLIFQAIFAWSSWPMDLIDTTFVALTTLVNNNLPAGVLTSLLADGVLPGLGGVVIFVPQIALLFLLLGLLEESGYMARVSVLLDRGLKKVGLNGKSVIPLVSGLACAVPALMSARTITNKKERLITLLVTPLVTCSARIPVYILIISVIIPEDSKLGWFNAQGLALSFMYVLGVLASLLVAFVFKKIIKTEEKSSFMMLMPSYQLPNIRNVLLMVINKVKTFVYGAGKIILIISMILWVLASNGPGEKYFSSEIPIAESYIGRMGKSIEPLIKPLGYDWKMGISLITSFAAREVFVGTMATIYGLEEGDDNLSLREAMKKERHVLTQTPVYSFATGFSLLIFYAFAMQCMSTVAIMYKETLSFKWTLVQFLYMTIGAYFLAMLTYKVLS